MVDAGRLSDQQKLNVAQKRRQRLGLNNYVLTIYKENGSGNIVNTFLKTINYCSQTKEGLRNKNHFSETFYKMPYFLAHLSECYFLRHRGSVSIVSRSSYFVHPAVLSHRYWNSSRYWSLVFLSNKATLTLYSNLYSVTSLKIDNYQSKVYCRYSFNQVCSLADQLTRCCKVSLYLIVRTFCKVLHKPWY